LLAIIARLSHDQRQIVYVAAAFADSDEWRMLNAPTAAHWIAEAADIEVSTAREWIRIGRRLRDLPRLAASFLSGSVSYSKIRTLTRFATPDNEEELLALAVNTPAGRLRRAIAAWVGRTSSAEELDRHHQASRSCTWRTEPDGMIVFTVRLPPLQAGIVAARLERTVMADNRPRGVAADATADTEAAARPTLPQQYADAFAAMAASTSTNATSVVHRTAATEAGASESSEPSKTEPQVEVVLHVRGDRATLDDGSPIPGSVVERVAPSSFLRALIHDAAGRPINSSSRRRHPTVRQKRVVKERDRSCVDCGGSALLEYDHVPPFAETGRTVVEELELRCSPCHARRHRRREGRPAA
jgi:hypothetical protein